MSNTNTGQHPNAHPVVYHATNCSPAQPISAYIGPPSYPPQPMHSPHFGQPSYGPVIPSAQSRVPGQRTSSIPVAQNAFGSFNRTQ
ncbi:hypothetical protein Tco_0470050, partial [Tanacetum coccineum]